MKRNEAKDYGKERKRLTRLVLAGIGVAIFIVALGIITNGDFYPEVLGGFFVVNLVFLILDSIYLIANIRKTNKK